jgi:hypothetical protein
MIQFDDNINNRYGIKLLDNGTVQKTAMLGNKESWECFLTIFSHFKDNHDPMVVSVHDFEVLEQPKDETALWGIQYKYRYTMKRLGMLNSGEKQLISDMREVSIYGNKSYGEKPSQRLLTSKDEYPELARFMEVIISQKRYLDIHDGNFLKDEDESYKVIDLEGFIYTPLNREENNWLRK